MSAGYHGIRIELKYFETTKQLLLDNIYAPLSNHRPIRLAVSRSLLNTVYYVYSNRLYLFLSAQHIRLQQRVPS